MSTDPTFDKRDYARGVKRTAKDFRRALRRALDPDIAGTFEEFDRCFRSDVSAIFAHLARGYEAVSVLGLHRSDEKPPQLEQAYFLLTEALNLVVVALRTLKGGSILASDGVLRQAFESAAVGYALAGDADGALLRKFVGGGWQQKDLKRSINTTKELYTSDWVGRLYGFLTTSAAHPSLAHVSHSVSSNEGGSRIRITAWFDPKERNRFQLGLIRVEWIAIFVAATAEAAFFPLLRRPRFWTITSDRLQWANDPVISRRLEQTEAQRRRIEEPFQTVYDSAEPEDRDEVLRLLGTSEGDALHDLPRLQQIAETHANSFVARYLLGAAFQDADDLERAIHEFEAAWRLRPNGYDVWSRLEGLYHRLGDLARREDFYRRSIALEPAAYVAVHNLGRLYLDQKRYGDAFECFRRAHEIEPSRYWAVYNGARALVMLGRHEEAIECYKHAIERDPEAPDPWHNIGIALARLDKLPDAYRAFRKAITLDPGYFASWINLAGVCQAMKRPLRAVLCALRAESLAPGDERVATLLRDLEAELIAAHGSSPRKPK